ARDTQDQSFWGFGNVESECLTIELLRFLKIIDGKTAKRFHFSKHDLLLFDGRCPGIRRRSAGVVPRGSSRYAGSRASTLIFFFDILMNPLDCAPSAAGH